VSTLTYRQGELSDVRASFEAGEQAHHRTIDEPLDDAILEAEWALSRDLIEFLSAHEGGYWVCEDAGELVGFARTARFGEMEELARLAVAPEYRRRGIARELLHRCWPDDPTPELGRVVVATGSPADLSLYLDFGVMPIAGHWHMRAQASDYTEGRSQEIDVAEPPVVALETGRAVSEWKRLEPPAIGHRRPQLHEFFGRTRTCLATMDGDNASALCWIGPHGEIGPAVGATPEDLVPVTLQALDRVVAKNEPDRLRIFCSTDSWWLLRRLRNLGFRVRWPSVVMSSIPLPGLDRYLPTRPAQLL
jgi:N-acetylglutamate synthase-like GNAT family acetyltransferase